MRPLVLSMQAFGPFAGREVVDFTRLPVGSLYLISGPTGAGKTSILDGICFALYGQSSGFERKASDLRSDHAVGTTLTEFALTFSLGQKHYRVRRSPAQERPVLRGSGFTTESAKAELFVTEDAVERLLVSGSDSVTALVQELMGFDALQFRQVVVLPQGQFRQLLSAGTAAREAILKTLFGTGLYQGVEEELAKRARALEAKGKEAKNGSEVLLKSAEAASVAELQARADTCQSQLEALAEQQQAVQAREQAANAALTAGRADQVKFDERDTARGLVQALELQEAAHQADQERLKAAVRADRALPTHVTHTSALGAVATAVENARHADEHHGQALTQAQAAESALVAQNGKQGLRTQAQTELLELQAQRERVAQLLAQTAVAEAARKSSEAQGARLQAADEALKQARVTLTQDTAQGEALAPVANALEARLLRLQQAEKLAAQKKELVELATTQTRAEADAEHARTQQAHVLSTWEAARAGLDAMDRQWRAAQAAVLARHLHEGEACPVCGSATHPNPAQADQSVPSDAQLTAAQQNVERAETQRQAGQDALAKATQLAAVALAAWQSAQERLASNAVDAALDVATARSQVSESEGAQRTWQQARARTDAGALRVDNLTADLELLRPLAQEAAQRAASEGGKLQELEAQVPEALRAQGAVETAITAAQVRVQRLDAELTAAQTAQAAAREKLAVAVERVASRGVAVTETREALTRAETAWQVALRTTGFADEAAFLAARLTADVSTALEARIQMHAELRTAAHDRLTRANAAVEGVPVPDLPTLAAALTAARDEADGLLREIQALTARRHSTLEILKQLAEFTARLGGIEAAFRVAGDLAKAANGNTPSRLTFQRFVLAALLDEVLEAATARLRVMTRNRYELVRRREPGDQRSAGGLDLDVLDQNTGRQRPAHSLSGGEGFLASLALALGLSDVVQRHAGGIQLDALFIDEGFGSLDSEALELAIDTLKALQAGGRSVGIISHVDELKQQIPAGIRVEAGLSGSHVHIAGAP